MKTRVLLKYFVTDCRFRGIKNREKLAREYLIISLLRSESSALENNFTTTNNNNNNMMKMMMVMMILMMVR